MSEAGKEDVWMTVKVVALLAAVVSGALGADQYIRAVSREVSAAQTADLRYEMSAFNERLTRMDNRQQAYQGENRNKFDEIMDLLSRLQETQ